MSRSLEELNASTPLQGANASYVEALYERFLEDPQGVSPEWRSYFEGLKGDSSREVAHGPVKDGVLARASAPRAATAATADSSAGPKQGAVSRLIQIYANRGHLIASIDPLGMMHRPTPRVLELGYFGLTEADLETEFFTGGRVEGVQKRGKLRDIIAELRRIYCGTIGAEFAHVSDTEERLWLQDRFQQGRLHHVFSKEEKRNILWQLTAAEGLERYLHTKYVGQKRFSLEGGDALIPLLDDLIQQCGLRDAEEMVIGMAHRGRLNVLVNVLGKSPSDAVLRVRGRLRHLQAEGLGRRQVPQGFLRRPARRRAATCTWRLPSIRRTSRSSTRWSRDRCAPARSGAAIPSGTACCRC